MVSGVTYLGLLGSEVSSGLRDLGRWHQSSHAFPRCQVSVGTNSELVSILEYPTVGNCVISHGSSPAEPADDGLSEAIITVIVLVSLIAAAGVAGAYAIFCGRAGRG